MGKYVTWSEQEPVEGLLVHLTPTGSANEFVGRDAVDEIEVIRTK